MLANITGHLIAFVENSQNPKEKVRYQLEVFSWDISDNCTDKGLHEAVFIDLRLISWKPLKGAIYQKQGKPELCN